MPSEDNQTESQRAGRVRHDASGRAIWEWAVDTGKHALDSTSRLLKRLELPGLKLEEDVPKKTEDEPPAPGSRTPDGRPIPTYGGPREADPLANSRQSFNPYDNRTPVKRGAAAAKPATPAGKPGAARAGAAPPARPKKPGLLARLFGRSR